VVESLVVTLDMYRRAFARGAALAVKNWPVLGSLFVYIAVLRLGGSLAVMLGIVGGFLMSLVLAACGGSLLYLVEMIVRTGRVTLEDFSHSFRAYLWDVVGVNFAIWIFMQIAAPLLLQSPQGATILRCIVLVAFVLFNAVPELIYLGHYSLIALFSTSYQFIASNWIEWFPPNLLLMVGLAMLWLYPVHGPAARIGQLAALSLFLYFTMIVRGLLFMDLDGSTRRSRIFRHKMGR